MVRWEWDGVLKNLTLHQTTDFLRPITLYCDFLNKRDRQTWRSSLSTFNRCTNHRKRIIITTLNSGRFYRTMQNLRNGTTDKFWGTVKWYDRTYRTPKYKKTCNCKIWVRQMNLNVHKTKETENHTRAGIMTQHLLFFSFLRGYDKKL